jgi:hypothetical protein
VVTSPLVNTGLSYHKVQPTKREHTNPGYLYSFYRTRAVCIILDMLSLGWLQILAWLPNTPYLFSSLLLIVLVNVVQYFLPNILGN